MARIARTLAARPEPGGTMLDNTLLLHMSDNGEHHHSNAEEWAMLLIGGDNLGFKTDGRSVTYRAATRVADRPARPAVGLKRHARRRGQGPSSGPTVAARGHDQGAPAPVTTRSGRCAPRKSTG